MRAGLNGEDTHEIETLIVYNINRRKKKKKNAYNIQNVNALFKMRTMFKK